MYLPYCKLIPHKTGNKIGSFGAQSLAEALKTNIALLTLRLASKEAIQY